MRGCIFPLRVNCIRKTTKTYQNQTNQTRDRPDHNTRTTQLEAGEPPPFSFLIVATPNVMTSRRQPLMETSDNTPAGSPAPTSTARRSGRATKAPEKFTPDAPAATKRKRTAEPDDEDAENESPDEGADPDNADEDASDTAEEEPRRARKKPSSQAARKKPAAKKPKINGDASVAEANHAPRQLVSRPKKAVRIAIAGREPDGLYGKIPPTHPSVALISLHLLTNPNPQPIYLVREIVPTRSPRSGITSTRPTRLLPLPTSSIVSSRPPVVTSMSRKTTSGIQITLRTDWQISRMFTPMRVLPTTL